MAIQRYDVVYSPEMGGGVGKKDNGKFCEYAEYEKLFKGIKEVRLLLGRGNSYMIVQDIAKGLDKLLENKDGR